VAPAVAELAPVSVPGAAARAECPAVGERVPADLAQAAGVPAAPVPRVSLEICGKAAAAARALAAVWAPVTPRAGQAPAVVLELAAAQEERARAAGLELARVVDQESAVQAPERVAAEQVLAAALALEAEEREPAAGQEQAVEREQGVAEREVGAAE
jgi:hypothetical protein